MQSILIASTAVAVIGLLIGLLLVTVGNKFKVETDPREAAVREFLPGNNCGGCGYAGCDAMAAAIVSGEAPVGGCPVGGAPVAEKIAQIMDVEAVTAERKVAYIKCSGDCEHSAPQSRYIGIEDCNSALACGLSAKSCDYGCMGFGSCAAVCNFGAISIIDGLARVDRSKCVACGKCVQACPKHLIELIPATASYAVKCSSRDKGPAVKKACQAGCIGCKICEKQCECDAVHVESNISLIDYEKCAGCGKCAEKCPVKVIELLS